MGVVDFDEICFGSYGFFDGSYLVFFELFDIFFIYGFCLVVMFVEGNIWGVDDVVWLFFYFGSCNNFLVYELRGNCGCFVVGVGNLNVNFDVLVVNKIDDVFYGFNLGVFL